MNVMTSMNAGHHNRVKPGPQIGAPPSLEQAPVARLRVDPSYQRATDGEASRRIIIGMVKKWDWSLCQPLVVARRPDGELYILDGQHRHAGAVERGDIQFLPCVVLSSLGIEEEARTFVELNTRRQRLTQAEVFHGMLAAGDPDAKQVAQLLETTDWKVRRGSNTAAYGPGELECAPMLVRVLATKGVHTIRFALAALRAAYPEKPVRVAATLLKALFEIFDRMGDESISTADIVNTLTNAEPGDWVTRGAVLRELKPTISQTAAIAQAMIDATRGTAPVGPSDAEIELDRQIADSLPAQPNTTTMREVRALPSRVVADNPEPRFGTSGKGWCSQPEHEPEPPADTGPCDAELELERQLAKAKSPKQAQGSIAAPAPAILPRRPNAAPIQAAFGTSGKGWCTQCEALRTRDQAKACQSAFCKLRPHV